MKTFTDAPPRSGRGVGSPEGGRDTHTATANDSDDPTKRAGPDEILPGGPGRGARGPSGECESGLVDYLGLDLRVREPTPVQVLETTTQRMQLLSRG